MILETANKKISLVLRTRKIVDIARTLKSKNFEEAFFKASNEKDLDALSKIIFTLAEDENGKNPFENSLEVLDFIDEYKAENEKTYDEIFIELAEVINEEGFFNKKMGKEEITQKISNSLSQIDTDSVIQKAIEKALVPMAQQLIAEA
jgi:hypothetical protein